MTLRFRTFATTRLAALALATVATMAMAGITWGVGPATADAEYIRDGIRINLRARPGQKYRIVKTLASGDRVTKLSEVDEWIQVRVDNGEQTVGWVPKGYLTAQVPASLALPRIQSQLASERQRNEALEAKLGAQAEAVLELDTLRARNTTLETLNMQLSGAERWRSLGMGALIALGGLIVGVFWPRGGGRGSRRIKL